MLSAFAGPAVVGWYGASRTIYGIITSPAVIVLTATFPELSRASLSLPDLRRMIDATGRILFWRGGSLWIGLAGEPASLHAHHAVQITLPFPGGHAQFQGPSGRWTSYTAALVTAHQPHAFEARAQLAKRQPGNRTAGSALPEFRSCQSVVSEESEGH